MTTSVALEEYELLGDPKYRNFVTAVDKALKTFEYSSEWADLISALGKLNKVLLSHIKFSVIPRRITISKRLAQCLHPALPSGVHLKALETYDIIFKCIGTSRLSQELFIYSAGLFPLLGNAAMNVRPVLLTIYESHFVPLGERLRPGLLGFLIGVLPGLEEGSDHYERTDSLLLSVCDGVEQSFFFGCLWRCVLTNPGVRLPAITFVLLHLDKKKSMEDQLHLIGTDIDAMVRGMCAALQDASVLVQRCALDLLLLGFPLHNSQLVQSDRIQILEAAVSVVLRRDMSLNRRLFAWLLGTDSSSCPTTSDKNYELQNGRNNVDDETFESLESNGLSQNSAYFNTYSKDLLLVALRNLFLDAQSSLMLLASSGHISGFPVLWPYRILISLLDRSEIGSHILEDILIEVFRALYKEVAIKSDQNRISYGTKRIKNSANVNVKFPTCHFETKTTDFQKELVKTANLLFGTLEPSFLWDYVGRLFQKVCIECEIEDTQLHLTGLSRSSNQPSDIVNPVGLPSIVELCKLVAFLLDVINVETYQDTPTIHLPELLATLGGLLTKYCKVLMLKEFAVTFQLCSKLLSKAQPVMYTGSNAFSSSHSRCKSTSSLDSNTTATSYSLSLRVDTPKSPLSDQIPREIEEKLVEGKDEHLCWISLDLSPDPQEQDSEESLLSNNFVLSKAVRVFQDFIAVFIQSKLLSNSDEATDAFLNYIVIADKSVEREKELQHLLCNCLGKTTTEDSVVVDSSLPKEKKINPSATSYSVKVSEVDDNVVVAFEGACQLLIELAAFPVYLTSRRSTKIQQRKRDFSENDPLPHWLKMLLTIGCLCDNSRLHLCAITALLELVALTHAALSITTDYNSQSFKSFPSGFDETGDSVTCVVNVPMINETHLQYLTHRTKFFALCASKLWSRVGQAPSDQQLKSVDLLQQVHNLAPDHPCHGSVCDVVICEGLSSSDQNIQMESLKKFCVLWHLTRDIRLKSNGGTALSRLFDRPLFLVLDQLGVESGPLKTIAESWLNHCLQRGDLARVLEPLLMVLLHPDTSRVSVQHVSVYCPMNSSSEERNKNDDQTSENDEAQIYAISSVGGNVIYHVSGASSSPNSRNSSPEKKVVALTSVVGAENDFLSSKFITSHALISGYEIPCSHERNLNHPISLFVNPFGSMTSLSSGDTHDHASQKIVPDLTNVRRINLKTFKKGYFDPMDSEESDEPEKKSQTNSEAEPKSVEEFAKSILDDIITSVIESDPKIDENEDKGVPKIQIGGEKDMTETYQDKLSNSSPIIHPLHGYLLLYTQVYDSQKVLYTLSSLKSIIIANPRLALWCMATTSVSQHSVTGSKGQDLQVLLARHRKSVFGNNFHGPLTSEAVTTYRSSMFVEVIVTTCLYYVRGVYPNLPKLQRWLTEDEVLGNRKVRLMALEVLTIVFTELVGIVKDGGRSVASYMNDLLNRCKVQKILLHCLSAQTVNTSSPDSSQEPVSFSKVIIDFNEEISDGEINSFQDTLQVGLLHLISKVIILEDTIGWLTATPAVAPGDGKESRASSVNSTTNSNIPTKSPSESRSGIEKTKSIRNPSISSLAPPFVVKYQIGVPIPAQPMFLSSILLALRQTNRCFLHSHWLSLVMATLPFTGGSGSKALSNLVVSVVSQLCLSLDSLATKQSLLHKSELNRENLSNEEATTWPPDYLINMVESLTTICHFCLLDSPAAASAAVANAASGTSNTGAAASAGIASHSISTRTVISQLTSTSSYASGINASQIISNLLHVFSPSDILNKEFVLGPDGASGAGAALEALLAVRRTLLSNLPRIMATLTDLWRLIGETDEFNSAVTSEAEKYKKYNSLEEENRKKKHQQLLWTLGSPKVVKQHILSFLSPLSVHYGSHFMAAVSVVWHDYRSHKSKTPNLALSSVRKIFPAWTVQQLQLVELVKAIKVFPFESIVQTVRQVLKQPPTTAADENQKRVPLEVSLLQFFLAYMQTSSGCTLVESWPSLLVLWREGLQLSSTPASGSNSSNNNPGSNQATMSSPLPIIQLHLLALLHEFVQKAPMLEDKRDQRDLQEVAQKLVDVCSEIAGSSLEQTNWLRRNLAVKPGPQPDLCDDDESDSQSPEKKPNSDNKANKSDLSGSTGNLWQASSNAQYSVQALQCLAEFLAPIMDVVYVSEEKEKVVSLLNNIMYYVTPYLRNHSVHNTPSFRACSQLLASISGYQYTRKSWKKDSFDLLLDSSFFQMESGECLGFWRHIIDHLMTHDKMTFRDFLGRVCIPQTGSLSIFSSREQEYEQRSQLLKRLAFVIFCSELDQYQKYMPDIQERLAECLRLPQVPSVQASVFLCFRVLLLRMSPDHMTSLWPNIITEMVQVFLQMEQELSTETEQFRKLSSSHIQRLSLLDSSWVVHSGNGLHAHNNPSWLQLYLSVCKLLDMVICLPANMLPQFQMYRWAFVADSPPVSSSEFKSKEDRNTDFPPQNHHHHNLKPVEQDFVPHIARLSVLLNQRVNANNGIDKSLPSIVNSSASPFLRMNSIKSLLQLQPFFNSLAFTSSLASYTTENDIFRGNNVMKDNCSVKDMIKLLESVMETDFIEPQLAS